MNPNLVKYRGPNPCWCCEGTGKAFNAINMEWDHCLICDATGAQPRTRLANDNAESSEPRPPIFPAEWLDD